MNDTKSYVKDKLKSLLEAMRGFNAKKTLGEGGRNNLMLPPAYGF